MFRGTWKRRKDQSKGDRKLTYNAIYSIKFGNCKCFYAYLIIK